MGYPRPLKVTHDIVSGVVLSHSAFSLLGGRGHIGNRMATIPLRDNSLLVWSSLPSDTDAFSEAIEKAGNGSISVAIVPDKEHTIAATGLKKRHPSVFVVGPSGIKDKPDLKLDYEFKDDQANKVIHGSTVHEKLEDFDFVFLNGHTNRELVVCDTKRGTLYAADLLFNIPADGKNPTQYPGTSQVSGLMGFVTSCMNPQSRVGRFFMNRLLFKNTPDNRAGLKAVMSMDFDRFVVSHGNIIDKDAKKILASTFPTHLA